MKRTFYILSLLLGVVLFMPNEIQQESSCVFNLVGGDSVWEEVQSDWEHQIEIISKDLQDSNCLALRRSSQTTSPTNNLRLFRTELKAHQFFCIKKTNLLRKVLEEVNTYQSINYSSLLCRMGYHVYGLRKILI